MISLGTTASTAGVSSWTGFDVLVNWFVAVFSVLQIPLALQAWTPQK